MELDALITLKTIHVEFTAILSSLTSISDELGPVSISNDDTVILSTLEFAAKRKLLEIETSLDLYPASMHLAAELIMK